MVTTPIVQKHTSEQTPVDLELATTILRHFVGEVEDLGPDKFWNFTAMFDDSFMKFATHRYMHPDVRDFICLPDSWTFICPTALARHISTTLPIM